MYPTRQFFFSVNRRVLKASRLPGIRFGGALGHGGSGCLSGWLFGGGGAGWLSNGRWLLLCWTDGRGRWARGCCLETLLLQQCLSLQGLYIIRCMYTCTFIVILLGFFFQKENVNRGDRLTLNFTLRIGTISMLQYYLFLLVWSKKVSVSLQRSAVDTKEMQEIQSGFSISHNSASVDSIVPRNFSTVP